MSRKLRMPKGAEGAAALTLFALLLADWAAWWLA